MGERHHEYLSCIPSVCDDEFPVCNRADEKVDDSQRIFLSLLVDIQSTRTVTCRNWLCVSPKRFIMGRRPTNLRRPMALSRVKITGPPMTEPSACAYMVAKEKKAF